jgi:CUB and sushi domain-containing protein
MFQKEIRCETPEPLENGLILGDDYGFGAFIFYECYPGFEMLNGDAKRECSGLGRWSGSQPVCSGNKTNNKSISTNIELKKLSAKSQL